MQVHIYDNAQQVGQAAATLFAAQLLRKPDSVLGLATGSSPIGCYQQLIAWHRAGKGAADDLAAWQHAQEVRGAGHGERG